MREFKVQRERYIEKCVRLAGIAEKCKVQSVHYRKCGDKRWLVAGVRVDTEGTSLFYDGDIAQAIGRYFNLSHGSAAARLVRRIRRGKKWVESDGKILLEILQNVAMCHKTRVDLEK